MSLHDRPKARQPWAREDDAEVRRLLGEGATVRDVALRLGRTIAAVEGRAKGVGLVLDRNQLARKVEGQQAGPDGRR
jgi:hypothetical protein